MKSKVFYVIVIMILGVILVTLTGCGKKEEQKAEVTQTAEKKEVKLTIADKKIVYTAKNEKGYKIPKINLAYDNIKEVNKEISEYGEQCLAAMKLTGNEVEEGGTLDYTYYENDNILSIVYEHESPFAANPDKYKVWNVDKYTGEVITNEQILAKKNIDAEDFKAEYKEKMGLYFEEIHKEAKESAGETFYNSQYEKTIDDTNADINNPMYLNENNEICMVSKIYSLAAADYYEHLVNIEK